MDLNLTVILLNDLIVAVAFFVVGFYVAELNAAKKKPKKKAPPPSSNIQYESKSTASTDKEDIMKKIRMARGQ
jgi:hypothetical protein